MKVQIQLLNKRCEVAYAKDGDGAFDLRANISSAVHIQPGQRRTIPTGIAVALQRGFGGFVIPRSGNASRHGISVTNSPGLIDSGYRGEVAAIVENRGDEAFTIEPFDRIAQFAIVPLVTAHIEYVDELDASERGDSGFGSTGKN